MIVRRLARIATSRWLIHGAGLFAVAVVAFNLHRIPLSAHEPEQWPDWPKSVASPAAVIISRAAVTAQNGPPGKPSNVPFSERDWSLAWVNTIHQEIGPCTLLDADSVTTEKLSSHTLVVLTRSSRGRLDAAALDALQRWTREGGAVVAELPGPELASLTGLAGTDERLGPVAPLRGLTAVPDLLPDRPGLAALPVYTRRPVAEDTFATAAPDTGAPSPTPIASLEDRPWLWARPLGDGLVMSVMLDFGLFLTATQQGRPEEDGSVRDRYPERLAPMLKSADLVVDEAYLDNDLPLADLLERAIIQYVRARVLVPALWYWPDGAPGVYLMTHDDEARGERAEWMPADESARGVPSTCYYIPGASLDGAPHGYLSADAKSLRRVAESGHTVGVHWVRRTPDYALRRLRGLPKLGPFLQEIGLQGQVDRLNGALPQGAQVRHSRLHYLLWDEQYAATFARLEAAGIALDSSYGPDFNCKGYLFGTAYPFHPLDLNGLPFKLWELPYQHSEMEAGADGEWLDRLAAASTSGDHAAIVSLFHPPFMAFAPSAETYSLWRELPERMQAAGHVPMTMERVVAFADARERTELVVARLSTGHWRIRYVVPDRESGTWLILPTTVAGVRVASIENEPLTRGSSPYGTVLAFPARGRGSLDLHAVDTR